MTDLDPRISTGTQGLDLVLGGGLTPQRIYLLEGAPGSGKTTLGIQFLREAARLGEPCLYITLSETAEEIAAVVQSHDWSLEGIDLFELAAIEGLNAGGWQQTVLHPWEMELGATVDLIKETVEKVRPRRVLFDSLSELRLLAQDPLRYRRQVLDLKQYFAGQNITVLLVDDMTDEHGGRDAHLHSIAHGVITLERNTTSFGSSRRRLQVQKMRGISFAGGYHDVILERGGIRVFPQLVAAHLHSDFIGEAISSGVSELDSLLSGGPRRGTSVLLTGPAGSGKSSIAMRYALAACSRGEMVTFYEFDERIGTLVARAKSMGEEIDEAIGDECLRLVQVDPTEIAPSQFAWMVREEVEKRGVKLLILDSLNGYLASMPDEKQLILQLHELLSYLNQQGVVTLLLNPQHGLVGTMMTGQLDISYVADSVILFRFFEAQGRLRKAISVLKNRSGPHEDAIRELRFDHQGVRIGDPLTDFNGVLTGTPEYIGKDRPLMDPRPNAPSA